MFGLLRTVISNLVPVLYVVFFVCSCSAPLNPVLPDDPVLGHHSIVRAKVSRIVSEKNGLQTVKLYICSVLYGPPEIKGQAIDFPIYRFGSHLVHFDPPLQEGEEGVWPVYLVDGEVNFACTIMNHYEWMRLPARKSISRTDYESAKEWAKDVAAVHRADPSQRKILLEQLTKSKNTRTSNWARESLMLMEENERHN